MKQQKLGLLQNEPSLKIRPLSKISVADPIKEESYMTRTKAVLRKKRDSTEVNSNASVGNNVQGESLGTVSILQQSNTTPGLPRQIDIEQADMNVDLRNMNSNRTLKRQKNIDPYAGALNSHDRSMERSEDKTLTPKQMNKLNNVTFNSYYPAGGDMRSSSGV